MLTNGGPGTGGFQPLEDGDPRVLGGYRLPAGGTARVRRHGAGVPVAHTGRAVAVKVIRPEPAENAEFRKRFRAEVAAASRGHGPLPVDTVLRLVAGVAEAPQAVHRERIVHRDLKPSNVLLAADGPRVIDFGVARAADATSVPQSGTSLGTVSYTAPEQALGGEAAPSADVFALGQTAVFAATGGGTPPAEK